MAGRAVRGPHDGSTLQRTASRLHPGRNRPASQARQAYDCIIARAADASGTLGLLVRRNLIDQMNQTLSVLPRCAEGENLADLTIETARACCQLQQIRQSFFGCF